MIILAIDTSCDETSVALVCGRRVVSSVVYSQILLHKSWGGVVPSIAKRAHEERIEGVIEECCRRALCVPGRMLPDGTALPSRRKGTTATETVLSAIGGIAVTQGPGLAIALGVGIQWAKQLAGRFGKPLYGINHLEGHLYSPFVENRAGNPMRPFEFPYLGLIVSGGHTDIVRLAGHASYDVLGSTLDDAAGEALDKAAKMLGLGYPGGPVLERLAEESDDTSYHRFPRPMEKSGDLRFSYSGLKTSLYYFLEKLPPGQKAPHLRDIAYGFQEAVFDVLIKKTRLAMEQTGITNLAVGGGVIANRRLRHLFRRLVVEKKGSVTFPPYPYLTGDNAAMIGVAANLRIEKGIGPTEPDALDRMPRMPLA